MSEPRRVYWRVLAHQHPTHADRCVWLPLGRLRLALCSRCLGLYPVLFIAFFVQLVLGCGRDWGIIDWLIVLVLAAPALLDWGASRLRWPGRNDLRIGSGALLGLALGRSLYLYVVDPLSELVWIQLALLAAGALTFELVRRLELGDA